MSRLFAGASLCEFRLSSFVALDEQVVVRLPCKTEFSNLIRLYNRRAAEMRRDFRFELFPPLVATYYPAHQEWRCARESLLIMNTLLVSFFPEDTSAKVIVPIAMCTGGRKRTRGTQKDLEETACDLHAPCKSDTADEEEIMRQTCFEGKRKRKMC